MFKDSRGTREQIGKVFSLERARELEYMVRFVGIRIEIRARLSRSTEWRK